MANDGQIVFEVTADGKRAISDIRDITRNIQQETKKWDDAAGQSANNIDSSFSGVLKKLAAGFSAVKIGKALLDLGKDAVSAASDLQEVQNVVDVTFGGNSNKIEDWARSAGDQFGLTETQAKRFASTIGAMAKSSGLAGSEIVDMSTDLAGLAADMASFYNLDFDTAFQKIRSGISGETEPLKQLGINMSVANLEAYAMQQGITKAFNAMSQGEQTMLRYQYLMSATADAQGDFARTSDSYANSMRKLETNVEKLKTTLGKGFIDVVTEATGFINTFIESLSPEEKASTVLDDFANIDLQTEAKLQDIEKVKQEAELTAGILAEIYGNGDKEQGAEAADVMAKFGVTSEEARKYLEGLGFSTEEINEKQGTWLETCKRLVQIIPGLSSIINVETGEINGGTQAVENYIQAWEQGQKKLVMLGALQQKENAITERFANLPGLELDMAVAERRVRENFKQLQAIYDKYGLQLGFDANGKVNRDFSSAFGLSAEDRAYLERETDYFETLSGNAKTAREAYETQKKALDEAVTALKEYRATVEAMPGEVGNATTATEKYWEDNASNVLLVANAAQEALKALNDYAQGVEDAAREAVNSVVKSFDAVDFSRLDRSKLERITDLTREMSKYEVGSDKWKELQAEVNKANEGLVTTNSIYKNLETQAEFLDTYIANLEKAQRMGLSDNLLAELSDGSVESAQYLDALVNDKTGKTAAEIDKKYQEIQSKKAQLSKELAGQQLSVDETYQNLAKSAKEAVAALDMQGEAAAASGNTISGVAQGISSHISEVASAVDGVLAELERLNGYRVSIDLGGFGNITFLTNTGKTEGSGRMGIPLVPHDDYIARLHEGERVLTAQENQIWNALRNGGIAGFDLDALGGVMRDNVRPGGDVYLDGRVVGAVISDQQGKSYRQLQRSGWQG